MKEKNQKIQILRGIAIIAVVLTHLCPSKEVEVFVRPCINFAVALFLFISGYLIDIEKINWKTFLKKRLIRILVPYTFWTIFYTTNSFHGAGFDFKKYVINFVSGNASVPLYFILMYMQFIVFTPLMAKLAKSKYKYVGFGISPIFAIIVTFLTFNKIEIHPIIAKILSVSCLGTFTFYYLGILLGNKIIKKKYNLKILVPLYVFTISIQIMETYFWYKAGIIDIGTQIKLSAILTSSIALLISYCYINNDKERKYVFGKIVGKIFAKLGDYSFGIYFFHTMVIMSLGWIPEYHSIPYILNTVLILVLSFECIFVVSKICGKRISRWLGLC